MNIVTISHVCEADQQTFRCMNQTSANNCADNLSGDQMSISAHEKLQSKHCGQFKFALQLSSFKIPNKQARTYFLLDAYVHVQCDV